MQWNTAVNDIILLSILSTETHEFQTKYLNINFKYVTYSWASQFHDTELNQRLPRFNIFWCSESFLLHSPSGYMLAFSFKCQTKIFQPTIIKGGLNAFW